MTRSESLIRWAAANVLCRTPPDSLLPTDSLIYLINEELYERYGITYSESTIKRVLSKLRREYPDIYHKLPWGRWNWNPRKGCGAWELIEAVDRLYRELNRPYGVRVRLTPEVMQRLCHFTLVSPEYLMPVIRMANSLYYEIFEYGTEGGFGPWILLRRPIE